MQEIQSMTHYEEAVNQDGAVLMFTAGWCPDCVAIDPVMPELEEKHNDLAFYKVNRDRFIELCQELEVMGIPSFIVFKNGKDVYRFVSRHRKTKEEIDTFLTDAKAK